MTYASVATMPLDMLRACVRGYSAHLEDEVLVMMKAPRPMSRAEFQTLTRMWLDGTLTDTEFRAIWEFFPVDGEKR